MNRDIMDLDTNFRPVAVADGLAWYDAATVPVEGRGWDDTEAFFDRLPARAKTIVRPPVWELSRHSAGMAVHFVTDAPVITVRWEVGDAALAMPHMPASGRSGVDLYGFHRGAWRWGGCGIPQGVTTTAAMGGALLPGEREYLLYLPLYNQVRSLALGLPADAVLKPPPLRAERGRKPLVVYGTSIVQGGCAARAGMGYPEIMARRLDRPSINLGFSGNGPMDPEMVGLLAELDAAVYVIDALPNMTPALVRERAVDFVSGLRQARPGVPIVLVENVTYQRAWLQAEGAAGHEAKNAELDRAFRTLIERGTGDLHRVSGAGLLGADGLGAVDGTHPTDLGFMRMACAMAPMVNSVINAAPYPEDHMSNSEL